MRIFLSLYINLVKITINIQIITFRESTQLVLWTNFGVVTDLFQAVDIIIKMQNTPEIVRKTARYTMILFIIIGEGN